MGRKLTCWWFLVGALSACRSIDIDPVGGGGSAVQGGAPPAGAAGAGGTPAEGGSGGQAPPCELCGGTECVDLENDEGNCGVCGEECLDECNAGTCTVVNGEGIRAVAFEQDYLYWVQVNAVWRSFQGTQPPLSKPVAEQAYYYDMAVENERVYLTYVGGPPIHLNWADGSEATAVCPADCDGAQVQPLTVQGLDGVGWTSNTGVYVRNPDLSPDPWSETAMFPGFSFAIAATAGGDRYAWSTANTVEFFPPSPALTGVESPVALAFGGTTLFAAEQAQAPQGVHRISCSEQPWESSQLLLEGVGATWLQATANLLFATVNPPPPEPSKLLQMPATCAGELDPTDVGLVAQPAAPCKLGGIAVSATGERVYWSQFAEPPGDGSACSGVFSRRFDAETLGTLADP